MNKSMASGQIAGIRYKNARGGEVKENSHLTIFSILCKWAYERNYFISEVPIIYFGSNNLSYCFTLYAVLVISFSQRRCGDLNTKTLLNISTRNIKISCLKTGQ